MRQIKFINVVRNCAFCAREFHKARNKSAPISQTYLSSKLNSKSSKMLHNQKLYSYYMRIYNYTHNYCVGYENSNACSAAHMYTRERDVGEGF